MGLLSAQRAKTFDGCEWFHDKAFATWVVQHLSAYGNSICDIGTGTGLMLLNYLDYFSPIVAIEPSSFMLPFVKERASKTKSILIRSVAESIPIRNKSVDVSVAKSSLHHFDNIPRAVSEMERISRKCIGVIEVVSPSDECIPFAKQVVLQKEPSRLEQTIFTEESLTSIVSRVAKSTDTLIYDQYINVKTWLQNSDLQEDEQEKIYTYILNQNNHIKNLMHIHHHKNKLLMLRRMALVIGVLNE